MAPQALLQFCRNILKLVFRAMIKILKNPRIKDYNVGIQKLTSKSDIHKHGIMLLKQKVDFFPHGFKHHHSSVLISSVIIMKIQRIC